MALARVTCSTEVSKCASNAAGDCCEERRRPDARRLQSETKHNIIKKLSAMYKNYRCFPEYRDLLIKMQNNIKHTYDHIHSHAPLRIPCELPVL